MARLNLKNVSIETLLNMSDDELLNLAKRGLDRKSLGEEKYVKMHRSQFAQITSRLVSVANKRIRQLGKSELGRSSPAYAYIEKMSPDMKFSVKSKEWNQLRNTMKEVKEWLNYKTSTIKGWKSVRANIRENTGMNFDSEYKSKKYWEVYRRLYELNSGLIPKKGSNSRLSSDRIQKILTATITQQRDTNGKRAFDWRSSVDRILERAQENIDNIYKFEQLNSPNNTDVGASRILDDMDEE